VSALRTLQGWLGNRRQGGYFAFPLVLADGHAEMYDLIS
jgi:hypothetical protein